MNVLSLLSFSLSLSLSLQYQGVLFHLLRQNAQARSSGLITKSQCVDYYSADIETRRFYQLDTSLNAIFSNENQFCVDYRVSR